MKTINDVKINDEGDKVYEDDSHVIPDYIKLMTNEELNAEIRRLEEEIRLERLSVNREEPIKEVLNVKDNL